MVGIFNQLSFIHNIIFIQSRFFKKVFDFNNVILCISNMTLRNEYLSVCNLQDSLKYIMLSFILQGIL